MTAFGRRSRSTADNRRACLGHRRLAIIDESRRSRAMLSHDGRYVLTYNGEIYNYRELREQLRPLGHQFRTAAMPKSCSRRSAEWGWDAMDHLNGMFAFAVWDNQERTLTLARSRRDQAAVLRVHSRQQRSAAGVCLRVGNQSDSRKQTDQAGAQPEALHQFLTFLWSRIQTHCSRASHSPARAPAPLSQRRDQTPPMVGRLVLAHRRRPQRSLVA